MSSDFSSFPLINYIGTPFSNGVFLCTPAVEKPAQVPIVIDWAAYGVVTGTLSKGVLVNLQAGGVKAPISQIRSIYIDNSFSNSPIYVQFPDTGFTVFAPPGAIVTQPVVTNLLQARVVGFSFFGNTQPKTNILFMNIEMQPNVSLADFSIDPVITPLGTLTTAAADGLTRTWTPVILATVDNPLSIICLYWTTTAVATSSLITACTVGGVSIFSSLVQQFCVVTAGVQSRGIAMFAVRLGKIGAFSSTVVATFSASISGATEPARCNTYQLTGNNNDSPIDEGIISIPIANPGSALALNLTYQRGAKGVYCGRSSIAAPVFSGTVNGSDFSQTSGQISAYAQSAIDVAKTVTFNTGYLAMGAVWR